MCDVMTATLTIFLSSIPLSPTNILNFMYLYIYITVYSIFIASEKGLFLYILLLHFLGWHESKNYHVKVKPFTVTYLQFS